MPWYCVFLGGYPQVSQVCASFLMCDFRWLFFSLFLSFFFFKNLSQGYFSLALVLCSETHTLPMAASFAYCQYLSLSQFLFNLFIFFNLFFLFHLPFLKTLSFSKKVCFILSGLALISDIYLLYFPAFGDLISEFCSFWFIFLFHALYLLNVF